MKIGKGFWHFPKPRGRLVLFTRITYTLNNQAIIYIWILCKQWDTKSVAHNKWVNTIDTYNDAFNHSPWKLSAKWLLGLRMLKAGSPHEEPSNLSLSPIFPSPTKQRNLQRKRWNYLMNSLQQTLLFGLVSFFWISNNALYWWNHFLYIKHALY